MTVEELRKKLEHYAPGKRVFLQAKKSLPDQPNGKPIQDIKERSQDGEEIIVLQ